MNGLICYSFRNIILFVFLGLICSCNNHKKDNLVKVLILSGKGNHKWQNTTPILVKAYEYSRLLRVNITEIPDTLTYIDLL